MGFQVPNQSRITNALFEAVPTPEIKLHVQGYPDRAIEHAREICQHFFGVYGAWHFTQLQLTPPALEEPDWNWQLSAKARLK